MILGMMENIRKKSGWKTMFSTVWQKKKNIEDGKPRRKFSLLGPQISSSQIGRKIVWRKVDFWHFYKSLESSLKINKINKYINNRKRERERERERETERWRMRATPASAGSLKCS